MWFMYWTGEFIHESHSLWAKTFNYHSARWTKILGHHNSQGERAVHTEGIVMTLGRKKPISWLNLPIQPQIQLNHIHGQSWARHWVYDGTDVFLCPGGHSLGGASDGWTPAFSDKRQWLKVSEQSLPPSSPWRIMKVYSLWHFQMRGPNPSPKRPMQCLTPLGAPQEHNKVCSDNVYSYISAGTHKTGCPHGPIPVTNLNLSLPALMGNTCQGRRTHTNHKLSAQL